MFPQTVPLSGRELEVLPIARLVPNHTSPSPSGLEKALRKAGFEVEGGTHHSGAWALVSIHARHEVASWLVRLGETPCADRRSLKGSTPPPAFRTIEFPSAPLHTPLAMRSHATIDARSLAFGQAIAARLGENPALVERARSTIARWLKSCSPQTRSTLAEWNAILAGPPSGVLAVLTDPGERATRLRQSNPFAGVLSQRERTAILREYVTYDEGPA